MGNRKEKNGYRLKICFLMAILLCCVGGWYIISFLMGNGQEEYYKAVHYFSDEWPLNFWNSELEDLSEDLEEIKRDGFNSIILVVPWREFQPEIDPISYNDYAFSALDNIVSEANKLDLNVFIRLGYVWDYYQDDKSNSRDRFNQLMSDNGVREAWLAYAECIWDSLNEYENFRGGFITWEDFWGTSYLPNNNINLDERIKRAEELGYQEYLKSNYSLKTLNEEFHTNFADFGDIPIPEKEDPMKRVWYEFYDNFLNELLIETQEVFANLSMEVRTDWDIVYDIEGNVSWYSHAATYGCGDAEYTATMYGIPQGSENNGEELTAEQALKLTDSIFENVYKENGEKDLFVEQFLFYDNTPGYSNNAKLIENEIGKYLENVDSVLEKYTCGYGIWTYHDYKSNMIYNSQFALGLKGWDVIGEKAEVIEMDGSNKVYLPEGSILKQYVPDTRNHYSLPEYYVEVDVNSDEEGYLEITFGNVTKKIFFEKGDNSVCVEYDSPETYSLEIKSYSDIYIDNIKVYNLIQNGRLYDSDELELQNIEDIRILNSKLDEL